MALITIGIGAVIILPIVISTATNTLNARKTTQAIEDQYAVSAGLEDAIWNLVWGDFQTTTLGVTGSSTQYLLSQNINGKDVDINIDRIASSPIAGSDFDSGGTSSGFGWNSDWEITAGAQITLQGVPYEGSGHLLVGALGEARRSIDTTSMDEVILRFWVKVDGLLPGDSISLRVSSNGTEWDTVRVWDDSDSDGVYRSYEVDLSGYSQSTQLWISFEGSIISLGQFYVDDLNISEADLFEILVSGQRQTVFAEVLAKSEGDVSIVSWSRSPNPTPTPIAPPTPTFTATPVPTFTPTTTPAPANIVIDFEGLSAGTLVNSVSHGSGISGDAVSGLVSVFGREPIFPGTNTAMIFDATCPGYCSGEDSDLRYPELGNIIIVSEDMDSGDPDDSARDETWLEFDFSSLDSGTVTVESIEVLDTEQFDAEIDLYSGGDGGTLLQSVSMPITGDNGQANMAIGVSGVDFMRVTLNGSGSIDNIALATEPTGAPTPTPTPSPTPTFTPSPTPTNTLNATIDFEGLSTGATINSAASGAGVSGDSVSGSISVFGGEPDFPGTNTAMIFNAACPEYCSGGDSDLYKPQLGKIIIVSEDMDSGDPDDSADYGSYLDFDFSSFGSGSVTVETIDVLDIEQSPASIKLYSGGQAGELLETVSIPNTGDNGLAVVNVNVSEVDFMRVTLNGSGAIDNIAVTTQ